MYSEHGIRAQCFQLLLMSEQQCQLRYFVLKLDVMWAKSNIVKLIFDMSFISRLSLLRSFFLMMRCSPKVRAGLGPHVLSVCCVWKFEDIL